MVTQYHPSSSVYDSVVKYCQPSQEVDCLSLSQWSTVSPSNGLNANGRTIPYIDSMGNTWVFVNSVSQSMLFCSVQSDCSQASNWVKGKIASAPNYSGVTAAYFEESGGQLRLITNYFTANLWTSGSCILATGSCGILSGGIFTGFSAVESTFISNAVTGIGKITNGYTIIYRDNAGTSQAKYMKCNGDFTNCRNYPANWSAASLMPDGQGHIWDTYLVRNVFVDDNGMPGAWLQNWTTSTVLHFY